MHRIINKQILCQHPLILESYSFLRAVSPWRCNRIFSEPKTKSSSGIISGVITDTLEWINEHISENLDADTIARKSGYSRWHFQREFKHLTGLSLKDFIRIRRVIAASKAVSSGKTPLNEIAPSYGFTNELCLLRAFRKYLHMTPTDLRASSYLSETN